MRTITSFISSIQWIKLVALCITLFCIVMYHAPSDVFAQSGPDIVVESIEFDPPNPAPGEAVDIIATVTNIGDSVGVPGHLYLWVDPVDNPPTVNTPDAKEVNFGLPLPPGGRTTIARTNVVFPDDTTISVWVRVDANDVTPETNDENNGVDNNLTGPVDLVIGNGGIVLDSDDCANNPYQLVVDDAPQPHDLHQLADEDFFTISLVEGNVYRAMAEAVGADADLSLGIVTDCTPGSLGSGATVEFLASHTGDYIMHVKHNNDVYGVDTAYTMQVILVAAADPNTDPYESDDACADATTLFVTDAQGSGLQHHKMPTGDQDWYQFSVTQGITYTFESVALGADLDLTYDLFQNCDPGTITVGGIGFDTTFFAYYDADYVLRVYDQGGSGSDNDYTIELFSSLPTVAPAVDTDGDGIPDEIEINGWDYDGDGVVDVDLAAIGADPTIRDILIEIDAIDDNGFSYAPDPQSIQIVVAAFAIQGIHLHIDYGATAPLTYGSAATWGALSEANALPYTQYAGDCSTGDFAWDDFDVTKAVNFSAAREAVFHYSPFMHALCPGWGGVAGISRNDTSSIDAFKMGASDLLMLYGPWLESNVTPPATSVAGVFMHELGHNLGLMHGGTNHDNYKPNYLSLMNYFYTETGLYRLDANDTPTWGHYDYSIIDSMDLDESDLDESIGLNIGVGTHNAAGTMYICPDYSTPVSNGVDAIDWDCNGDTAGANIVSDLNFDGDTNDIISTQNDWDHIVLDGGSIGSFDSANTFGAFGIDLSIRTSPIEMRLDVIQQALIDAGVGSQVPVQIGPFNYPPQFTEVAGSYSAELDSDVSITVAAVDDVTDSVTYSATGLPAGLSIDATTGEISGRPDTPGLYESAVTATDGEFSSTVNVSWSVEGEIVPPLAVQTMGQSATPFTSVMLLIAMWTGLIAGTVTMVRRSR